MKKYLWVEEYAPKTIDECILPDDLKQEFLSMKEIPNMLLVGDAGVGKTTVAKVLCDTHNVDMMFMNASSERGIDEIRTKVTDFASTSSLFGGYKVILLDEADNLTNDAQKAMRHLIEKYQNNCRFILTCNYVADLIEPLQSRLTRFDFIFKENLTNPFTKRMIEILQNEEVKIKEADVPALIELASLTVPNFRSAIHNLQRACNTGSFNKSIIDKIKASHVSTLIECMKVKNFTKVREWIAETVSKTLNINSVIDGIYWECMRHALPDDQKPSAVLIMGQYQVNAAVVSNHEINLTAMCVELMMNCKFK